MVSGCLRPGGTRPGCPTGSTSPGLSRAATRTDGSFRFASGGIPCPLTFHRAGCESDPCTVHWSPELVPSQCREALAGEEMLASSSAESSVRQYRSLSEIRGPAPQLPTNVMSLPRITAASFFLIDLLPTYRLPAPSWRRAGRPQFSASIRCVGGEVDQCHCAAPPLVWTEHGPNLQHLDFKGTEEVQLRASCFRGWTGTLARGWTSPDRQVRQAIDVAVRRPRR